MKKEETLHVNIFGELIQLATTKLKSGHTRFFDIKRSEFSLTDACLRDIKHPYFSQRFMTCRGEVPRNNEDVQKDFYEEIDLIANLIDECEIPVMFKKYESAKLNFVHTSVSKKNIALQVWRWYAIPWRFKNKSVYIIWPPYDIMGEPTIEAWPIDYFLTTMADISRLQKISQVKIDRQLKFWKNFGSFFIAIMIFTVYIIVVSWLN